MLFWVLFKHICNIESQCRNLSQVIPSKHLPSLEWPWHYFVCVWLTVTLWGWKGYTLMLPFKEQDYMESQWQCPYDRPALWNFEAILILLSNLSFPCREDPLTWIFSEPLWKYPVPLGLLIAEWRIPKQCKDTDSHPWPSFLALFLSSPLHSTVCAKQKALKPSSCPGIEFQLRPLQSTLWLWVSYFDPCPSILSSMKCGQWHFTDDCENRVR